MHQHDMPPKPSKKQLEAEKKAEEERLAALAEAERLERLRLEKEALERQMQAADDAWVNQKRAEFESEEAENTVFVSARNDAIAALRATSRAQAEWKSFMSCSKLPDINKESSFYDWLADWGAVTPLTLPDVCQQLNDAETLCRDLLVGAITAEEKQDAAAAEKYQNLLMSLQGLMRGKLNATTAWLLLHYETHVNVKNELQMSSEASNVDVGLWVNVAKNIRIKNVEFASMGVTLELPKQLIMNSTAVRVQRLRRDDCAPFASGGTMQAFGGVCRIEVFTMAPQSKTLRGITMRTSAVGGPSLVPFPYPPLGADGSVQVCPPPPPTPPPLHLLRTNACPPQQNTPPLRVTMVVPDDASVGPNPQVGWWNEGKKEWDTDGISEVAFDSDTRRLTFASVRMTALSLVQSRIVSLPYRSWVIRPLSANSASITVATAVDSVELLVTDSAVRLVAPRSASIEASHPQGMPPGLLLKTLQSYGLNLSPSPSDAALIQGLVPKDKVMEAFACKEIASIAPGFAVTYSCHNQRLPDTNIAVRTRHCTDYAQPPDMEPEAWQLVHFRMAPLLMCAFNPTAEAAEAWTEHRPAQIPSACAHLPKLLAGGAPDTCLQRCDDASPLFLETLCVRLLLRCAAAWCNTVSCPQMLHLAAAAPVLV
jgi:hypothetical protein